MKLISSKRAQNVAIVLARLSLSTEVFWRCVVSLVIGCPLWAVAYSC